MALDPALEAIYDSTDSLAREIENARWAAHQKHGENSIEAVPADSPLFLPILVEEIGEVGRALTYDNGAGSLDRVREELVDVLAVATAWVAAIDRKKAEPSIDLRPAATELEKRGEL